MVINIIRIVIVEDVRIVVRLGYFLYFVDLENKVNKYLIFKYFNWDGLIK